MDRLIGGYAAIAAAIAGGLYLAGVMTLSVRLWDAGLTTGDILPLFSLEQLLRVGLTWLSPAVPAMLVLAALYVASVVFETRLDRRAAEFRDQWAPRLDEEARADWIAAFDEQRRRTAWQELETIVKKAIEESPDGEDASLAKSLRRRLGLMGTWTVGVILVLFASCLVLAPVIGIATFVLLIVAAVLVGTRPALTGLAPLYAVVLLGILANAVLNPRPFPHATVITQKAPATHQGDLVVRSDGAWFLATGRGRVEAIPADRVVCSTLESRPRDRPLWRFMLGVDAKPSAAETSDCAPG